MSGGRNSASYKRARKQRMDAARLANEPCMRCHGFIDYGLSGNHPHGPTLDHMFPVLHTGSEDFEQWAAGISHRRCNLAHGGSLGHRPAAARFVPAEQILQTVPATVTPPVVVWELPAVF